MAMPTVSTVTIEIVSSEIPFFICVFSFSHEKNNNNVIKRHADSNFLSINVFVWLRNIYSKKYTGIIDYEIGLLTCPFSYYLGLMSNKGFLLIALRQAQGDTPNTNRNF